MGCVGVVGFTHALKGPEERDSLSKKDSLVKLSQTPQYITMCRNIFTVGKQLQVCGVVTCLMTDVNDQPAEDTADGTADEPEPWPGKWKSVVELKSTAARNKDE